MADIDIEKFRRLIGRLKSFAEILEGDVMYGPSPNLVEFDLQTIEKTVNTIRALLKD